MLRALLIMLPLAFAQAADLRIDHVTIAGAKLDQMRQAFSSATGISPEYGGPHANRATEMALVSFPDGSYLELMGLQPQADPAEVLKHTWSKFLRNNLGPCAFALRVPDVSEEVRRLGAAGIKVGEPETSGRTRPDGFRLSWETADIGPGARGSLFPFLIRDITPREKRVYPAGNPTTTRFRGIAKVVIGVRNLDDAIAQYRRAYGLDEPKRQLDEAFGAELAWFEGTPIVLAHGLGADSWLTQRVAGYGDAPCAFILAGSGGPMGAAATAWFGHDVIWASDRLGWRLGFER
jgi:catechol 2,3-dioxygenase-like lactoylglutathione lyase family enzyme